jgi:hypothetical protein
VDSVLPHPKKVKKKKKYVKRNEREDAKEHKSEAEINLDDQ